MLTWLGLSGRGGQLVLRLAFTVSVVAACTSATSPAAPSAGSPPSGSTRAADATITAPYPAITPVRTRAPLYFPYEISNAVGLASGFFSENDATFGGAYVDVGGTGHGVFLFTGNALSRQSAVAAHLPPGMPFELRSVLRSQQDLLALKARIEADRPSLEDELGLVSTGIATERNAVLVGLLDPTPLRQRTLIDRYGEGLEFRADRPSVFD